MSGRGPDRRPRRNRKAMIHPIRPRRSPSWGQLVQRAQRKQATRQRQAATQQQQQAKHQRQRAELLDKWRDQHPDDTPPAAPDASRHW